MKIAAIDIGTNTTRLLTGEVSDDSLVVETRREQITRLGEGVNKNRFLAESAIERTLGALETYQFAFQSADKKAVIATSACRDATNLEEFFIRAEDVLGRKPEVISGDREAELSFRGATQSLPAENNAPPFLVFDIGGGSTEFAYGAQKPELTMSVDVGSVRITEMFLGSDPPQPEELSNALFYVRDQLALVSSKIPGVAQTRTVIGVAGTVDTVAAIELGVQLESLTDYFPLTRSASEEVFRTLATEPLSARISNPGLEPARADVIVGGALILVAIMRHWDLETVLASRPDLLDGLALEIAGR